MDTTTKGTFWLRFSVFNLMIVAILGTLMRYKIAYSLPFLDQKHLQEAHSHFAFYGWISQILYVFLIGYIRGKIEDRKLKKYEITLWFNALGALLMIPTFLAFGYNALSIAASSICLFSGIALLIFLWMDFRSSKDLILRWFKTGLFLAAFSSIGVFTLAYIRSTGLSDQNLYLSATYFYLHFQYNGCFILMAMGFFLESLKKIGVQISDKEHHWIYYLFLVGAVIGYGLSVLWLKLPLWIYILVVLSALAQTYGSVRLVRLVRENWSRLILHFSPLQRMVLLFVAFAFLSKITLQLISVIPQVSQFAFGFRNVVIAYLHLVLLMCLTAFLLNQIFATNRFWMTRRLKFFFVLTLVCIFLNEAILGIIGLLSIRYIAIPYASSYLLLVSIGIVVGVVGIFLTLRSKEKPLKMRKA